jgi:hypothetical protein
MLVQQTQINQNDHLLSLSLFILMSEHVNFQPLCTTYGQRKNRLQNENDEVGKMVLLQNFKTKSSEMS